MHCLFTVLSLGCKRFIETHVTTFRNEHNEHFTHYTFSWADIIVLRSDTSRSSLFSVLPLT